MLLRQIQTPLSSISGVGENTEHLFARLGVLNIGDLLAFYPRDYDDRTKTVQFCDWMKGRVRCVAVVTSHEWVRGKRGRTLCLNLSDGFMDARCAAFGRAFMERAFPVGTIVLVTGKFTQGRGGRLEAGTFELVTLEAADKGGTIDDWQGKDLPESGVLPIYPLTEGLKQKSVRKIMAAAIRGYTQGVEDEVPPALCRKRLLMHKRAALLGVHQPATLEDAAEARQTLIYEELFTLCCAIARRAYEHRGTLPLPAGSEGSIPLANGHNQNDEDVQKAFTASLSPRQKKLLELLTFPLTRDQMRVITEMNDDIDRGYKERASRLSAENDGALPPDRPLFTMQRLLQGDVGSGKTLVALFVCIRVIDWRGQCAFMAPTELLARQHADSAARLLEPLDVRVAFLSGNVKAKQRGALLSRLADGSIDIVVGTHALFSAPVCYNDLCLAVIDEQHKFGVLQRQAIIAKGHKYKDEKTNVLCPPHLLMMSATPIPQSLALTVFGDLDVSAIHTMPCGRKPITTYLVREGNERNAYEAVRHQLQSGHQAYFVYPAIEAGESGRKSAEEAFAFLASKVYPEYRCALLHSKVDEDEQVATIADFREGKVQVLAATTVIEVGVDVPNASCIVIEGADCFGMAQLHQLRGRVGRGAAQSYCFLIYSKDITEVGIQRMKALRESTDGFNIAEQDLRLRGPGEVAGTMQSGVLRLGIADIERDADVLCIARDDALSYVEQELQCSPAATVSWQTP